MSDVANEQVDEAVVPAPSETPSEAMDTVEASKLTEESTKEDGQAVLPSSVEESEKRSESKEASQGPVDSNKAATLAANRSAPTVPTRQYLDQTVVPILLQGLGSLAKERPEDPITFLANFLLREKEKYTAAVSADHSKIMEVPQNKLFVGNLPENCDPNKLKQIFSTHIRVTHCDLVKNYAFVHVVPEDTPKINEIIKKLDGYMYEGKMLNLKSSTSKMRGTVAGQETTCFRCGENSHRTMNCPKNDTPHSLLTEVVRVDLTGKRSASSADGPDAKRLCEQIATVDQELGRPIDAELLPLYNQYVDARNKYTYCKDRLIREQQARNRLVAYTSGTIVPTLTGPALTPQTVAAATYAGTQAQPTTYTQTQQPVTVQALPQAAPYTIVQTAQGQTVLYPTSQVAGQTVFYAQPGAAQQQVGQHGTAAVGQPQQTYSAQPQAAGATPSAPYATMVNAQAYAPSAQTASGVMSSGTSYQTQQAPYSSSVVTSMAGGSHTATTHQYSSTTSGPQAPYQSSTPWMQSTMVPRN
ncbi:unnamed protein product, partial [Mesorhabditis belari]|uniref:Uncharacterized protein n=1 Tax=Mesorhabditis belari TaxID=2138241 RepID=A0AAF3JBK6_9BILA